MTGVEALHLMLAGGAAVRRGDGAIKPLAPIDAALLAFVAIEGSVSRERVLRLLWPGHEAESARNVLRQRLFRLRRGAGADVVAQGAELLALAPGVSHDLDDDGEGELLAGLHYTDCGELDSWLDAQRADLRRRRRQRRDARIDALESEGRLAEGLALAERLVAADPLDEAAVRRLMQLHYLQGERGTALAVYERFVGALAKALDAAPSARTRELMETIRAAPAPQPAAPRRDMPASLLRPPRLVGRDKERAALGAAWAGRCAFWLLGEAGLGKTRLIADFAAEAMAGAASTRVLVVAARPGDAGVPYASLGRALRAVIELTEAPLETAQRRELARVLPEIEVPFPGVAATGRHLTLPAALDALLADAHGDGLAALIIDDLHFADGASLEMLQGLVLGASGSALRWGFTQRPAEGDAAVEALRAALEEAHRIEPVRLQALDEPAMLELVASLGLGYDPVRLAPLLARHTGGNPLYALETLKHLIATGARSLDDGLPRPPSIRQLIERRLRQLSAPAMTLARIAAIAGVDFSIELAEQVLETRALALTDPWRELEEAQVLREFAFAHDLVLEATLAGIPAPIAAHAHGAIAAFLEARGHAPARVAAHWIASGQAQRARVALHAAADAARRAMRRKEEAGFLWRAAQIEAEHGDAALFETLRAMIDALWVADRGGLDAVTYDRLEAAAATPQQRGIALGLRATWAHEQGDIEGAKRMCRQAIDLADAATDEATGSEVRRRLAQILHFCGEFDGAVALMQQLQPWFADRASDAEKVDFYGELAIVLDNADRGSEARTYHKRSLELARRIGAWSDVTTVLANLAISWATAGYMARAIDLLHEAMRLAAAHDEAHGCGASLPIELHNALRDSGRYGDALNWIEPALAAADGQLAAWKPLVRCHVACSWIHLGQHARAQRELDAALAAAAPDWIRAKALQMRARMRIGMGRGAQAPLEEAHALMASDGRRTLRASIMLDHAAMLGPEAALAAAREVIAEGEQRGLPGTALAGQIRAMRFAVDAGRAADAVLHARAGAAIDADVMPSDLYPAERWLNAWRAWQLAGDRAEADAALAQGARWVRRALRSHVPEPFRDSFVRANPVNQQLLRTAAQAGLDGTADERAEGS